MKGDEKVIDFLNKALTNELTAINQYWLHYRVLDDWGVTKLAAYERKESIEEMEHADTLIERIIFLEGHPNLQTLDPLRIGETLKETLECDLAAEYSARDLYMEARAVCRDEGDYASMNIFETLINDEEGHIDFLETQLQLMESIGEANYGQLNAASADQAED